METVLKTTGRDSAIGHHALSEGDERQSWLEGQKEAFQHALNDADLATSLAPLVRTVTAHFGGTARCAFFIANPEGTAIYHVIGMPAGYAKAIDGFKIGGDSIACGLAAHSGRAIITHDVTVEPLWKDLVWVAREFNFRGCWSFPVETSTGKIVGTFAIYHDDPREPVERDYALAQAMTVAGAVVIAQMHSKQERARAEEALSLNEKRLADALSAQVMLTAEMEHRVKNVFMIVESMIRTSRKTATSTSDLADTLSGRLMALSSAHALVRREFSENAAPQVTVLKDVLEAVLRPHTSAPNAPDASFVLSGPAVSCSERAVSSLALVFHELTTNAAKHGALSNTDGQIIVDWAVEQDVLAVKWHEQAHQAIAPSAPGSGFGKTLIEAVVCRQLGGKIQQNWTDVGLKIELAVPIASITA